MSARDRENDVYFLGHDKAALGRHRRVIVPLCLVVCLALAMAVCLFRNTRDARGGQELAEIEVLPEQASAPMFEGKHDFRMFTRWLSDNIKYPHGYEKEAAKVMVSFVITKEGKLDSIKVDSQPGQEAFASQVESVLRTCPRWAPGKLADGTPIDIRYTLPVRFNNIKRFN